MKCIKAIKDSKSYKVGDIVRVKDVEANEKVITGYFTYVPKSEWKSVTARAVDIKKSQEAVEKANVALSISTSTEVPKTKIQKVKRK